MMSNDVDALASLLTAEGPGAIAVIKIWGKDAVLVADRAFRPAKGTSLANTPPGRLRFGRAGEGLGDEVVAVVINREPLEVEIQSHAGEAARLVLRALSNFGARVVSPEIRLAKESRYDALVMKALVQAPTMRVASILHEQRSEIVRAELESLIEEIDSGFSSCSERLDSLIRRSEIGKRLIVGWKVVLTGRPNVGKSRLLNALAGYDRAIVAPEAGTTRDVVTVRTVIDGWPVELADTAGLRRPESDLEASGIDLAQRQLATADLVLVILDRSEILTPDDRSALAQYPLALLVANKCDLPASWNAETEGAIDVSAATGEGIDRLIRAISSRIVPEPPLPSSVIPIDEEMITGLGDVRRFLRAGQRVEAIKGLRDMIACGDPLPHRE